MLNRSLLCVLALAVSGCAAQRSTEGAPAAPPSVGRPAPPADEAEGEPANLADAERRLARASSDLDTLLGPTASSGAPAGAAAGAPSPMAPPATDSAAGPPASSLQSGGDGDAKKESSGACASACKAFASLSRAADAVCRIAGEGDPRCARARSLREEKRGRVASCGC